MTPHSELSKEALCARIEALERELAARRPTGAEGGNSPGPLVGSIVTSSEDAVISKSLDGVIQSWNPAAQRMFGYTAAEAIGQSMRMLFPPDRLSEESSILHQIAQGLNVDHFETVRVRRDGVQFDVSVSISPVRTPEGTVIGAATITRDISDRKRLDRQLFSAIAELRDIKAALDEHSIVAITDAEGRITYVNDKFCSISQYSRHELLGKDHRIINSRHHPKEFFRDLWQTLRSGKVWHGEIRNRAKDGSHYWVDTTIYPRLSPTGHPEQFIAIRTDITQRKNDETNLRRFASDLAERNKELETIVYTVSHDLRSPLVNVQGFSKQLARACERIQAAMTASSDGRVAVADLKPAVETSIPQSLRFIHAGVSKMEMLLAGLLKYSRLGRVTLTIRPINMNTMLAEIVAAMAFQINEIKAEVRIEPLPGCLGDLGQTNQIFANLLDNALKYRSPQRALRVTVTGKVDAAQVIYAVTDNGIGIAPDHQAKAFEIFHRLNPQSSTGEGLGLTIAQRVVERQGGRIWVESQEGVGSTFFVSLPNCEQSPPRDA